MHSGAMCAQLLCTRNNNIKTKWTRKPPQTTTTTTTTWAGVWCEIAFVCESTSVPRTSSSVLDYLRDAAHVPGIRHQFIDFYPLSPHSRWSYEATNKTAENITFRILSPHSLRHKIAHTHTETPSAVISRDCVDASPLSKRQRSSQDIFNQTDDSTSRNYQSQPMPQLPADQDAAGGRVAGADGVDGGRQMFEARNGFCFSQPAMMDDLILCTQLNSTQSASQNLFQKLVRRMTRFFVSTSFEESIRRVTASVAKLAYQCRVSDEGVVSGFFCFYIL